MSHFKVMEPEQPGEVNTERQEDEIRPTLPEIGMRPSLIYTGVIPTNTRLKVTLKKMHICGEWKWLQGGEDTCGICRMEFESACNMCKFPGDDCPLVVGTCRHAFHQHCIDKWIAAPTNQPRPQCPLCRQDWVIADL